VQKEEVDYIINYFSHLLKDGEKMTLKQGTYMYKHDNSASGDGYGNFRQQIADRIMLEHGDKVIFNNCPVCGKLARTPDAKQCRHCWHDWQD
jgi:hypothetical protein